MDSQASIPDVELEKCCECGCSYCSTGVGNSQHWSRAVKRKVDGFEDGNGDVFSGVSYPVPPTARVQIENECDALREIVNKQQQSIQDLYMELEEERNSSSTAANETMSMILRLQRDKSEIQMEARQFKSYAEEKIAHDQQEISALEDLLYKREQVVQSLTCEVQAYKHRMMSYGLTESEAEGEIDDDGLSHGGQFGFPRYEYPPLRCTTEVNRFSEVENDFAEVDKYSFGGTPRSVHQLKNLDLRISQMERSPRLSEFDVESPATKSIIEKAVVGQSHMIHTRKFSVDNSNSFLGYGQESFSNFPSESPRFGSSFKKMDYVVHTHDHSNARRVDNTSEVGDYMKDRLYTMDNAYNGAPCTTRKFANHDEFEDPEISKLYMRLQALEAERESMRQTLISMSTDKAQLVLLKEIAQQLCNDMAPKRRMPTLKPSIFSIFPFVTVFQWVASIVFWRKGANPSKYMFGLNANNMGLLMLLDRGPHAKPWRCLTRPLM